MDQFGVKEGDTMAKELQPYSWRGWQSLSHVARRLIAARFLRSIAQGALGVDFTLYLAARHWSAAEVGLLLMAGGLAGAGLSLLVGTVSDRVGRRVFLLVYEIGLILGTMAIIFFPEAWILVVTAAVFGFGRGANGSSGPFAPAEQAWLAQAVPGQRRGSIFSFNAGLQFWGMGFGSLLAGILPRLVPGISGPDSYVPVFALNLAMAIVNLWQIASLREERQMAPTLQNSDQGRADEAKVHHRENRALMLLTGVNMVNSLGIGLVAPLLPYWFHLKFGVGPGAIGSVYALSFFLTGISSLMVGKLSERVGLIRSIVLPRLLGVVLLIAIPFMPAFGYAAVLYVARSIVNRGSVGARQAFSVGLVRDHRRGLASSLNAVSWSLPAALGPAIGGWLIGTGSLTLPFALAAGLQLSYAILFPTLMSQYEPDRKSPAVEVSNRGGQGSG